VGRFAALCAWVQRVPPGHALRKLERQAEKGLERASSGLRAKRIAGLEQICDQRRRIWAKQIETARSQTEEALPEVGTLAAIVELEPRTALAQQPQAT